MEKQISVIVADSSDCFRKMLSELIDAEEDMCVAASVDNGKKAIELILLRIFQRLCRGGSQQPWRGTIFSQTLQNYGFD